MDRQNPFLNLEDQSLPPSGDRPLEVCLLRGTAVESRHRVHVIVHHAQQGIIQQWGNTALPLFPRSSIKLMQALLWVAPEFYKKWELGFAEMAVSCGSHSGEPFHVKTVKQWLDKLGLSETALECGAHEPYDKKSNHALIREGKKPSPLHNNCSGKHAGILTACMGMGWSVEGYSNYDHPAQEGIRKILGVFLEQDVRGLAWGIDGCGIPTYSVPLNALAAAFASVAKPNKLPDELKAGVKLLNQAIAAKSEYIGGTESFCTKIVAETEGRVFAKVGAEGVYGAWIPGAEIGIAIKCEDGASRAAEAALVAVLGELGHTIGSYSALVRRWGGEVVGQFFCA
ncbi:MAG: asparaginase [Bdellovibrionota bacterium]